MRSFPITSLLTSSDKLRGQLLLVLDYSPHDTICSAMHLYDCGGRPLIIPDDWRLTSETSSKQRIHDHLA
jgi:hypothetical protein